ncbi:MAG: hypothetical protein ACRDYV_08005 [Acidimicrobiia bacterium]
MTIEDVLAQALAVDWAGFDQPCLPRRQTTGTALRALLEARPEDALERQWRVLDAVWHQGSSYEGATALIPLAATLVAEPDCPNRNRLLGILTLLGGGFPEDTVKDLLTRPEKLPSTWSGPSGAAARDALNLQAGTLRLLVADDDPPVRQMAAYALVLCPASAAASAERLGRSLPEERHAPTLAAAWCVSARSTFSAVA